MTNPLNPFQRREAELEARAAQLQADLAAGRRVEPEAHFKLALDRAANPDVVPYRDGLAVRLACGGWVELSRNGKALYHGEYSNV